MMTVQNAQKLIEDYNYLINEDHEGLVIEALAVTPRNDPEFSEAITLYNRTHDSSLIYPASSEIGYTVTVIFRLRGIVRPHSEIFSVLDKKGIGIDFSDYGIEL